MVRYISLLLFIGLAWGQDCTADDGTDGADLWGECYSIENTTELHLGNNGLTGSIPPEIGNLTNLTHLNLRYNQLNGEIPESICDLNIEWSSSWSFNISNNQLCPPYPSCIEDYVGT
jgi:Leucine-rich repeat (LRR) protein